MVTPEGYLSCQVWWAQGLTGSFDNVRAGVWDHFGSLEDGPESWFWATHSQYGPVNHFSSPGWRAGQYFGPLSGPNWGLLQQHFSGSIPCSCWVPTRRTVPQTALLLGSLGHLPPSTGGFLRGKPEVGGEITHFCTIIYICISSWGLGLSHRTDFTVEYNQQLLPRNNCDK